MFKKIGFAIRLRLLATSFSKVDEDRKLFLKVFKSYFRDCVLKGKNNFQLKFKAIYKKSFFERILNWIEYYSCIAFIATHKSSCTKLFGTRNSSFNNYESVFGHVYPPLHSKVADVPNEYVLVAFLRENGFKIKEKKIENMATIYEIQA